MIMTFDSINFTRARNSTRSWRRNSMGNKSINRLMLPLLSHVLALRLKFPQNSSPCQPHCTYAGLKQSRCRCQWRCNMCTTYLLHHDWRLRQMQFTKQLKVHIIQRRSNIAHSSITPALLRRAVDLHHEAVESFISYASHSISFGRVFASIVLCTAGTVRMLIYDIAIRLNDKHKNLSVLCAATAWRKRANIPHSTITRTLSNVRTESVPLMLSWLLVHAKTNKENRNQRIGFILEIFVLRFTRAEVRTEFNIGRPADRSAEQRNLAEKFFRREIRLKQRIIA